MTTIAFLGDTLLGGTAQPFLERYGSDYQLREIRQLWADADLVVANHEGPITALAEPDRDLDTGRRRPHYRANPQSAGALAASGIGVVSLANDHVTDFGPKALADTLALLDGAGIAHCGAGPDDRSARRPAVVDVDGLRIGFLSFMQYYDLARSQQLYATVERPGAALLRPSRLATEVGRLRDSVDLCVVLVHWGRAYRPLTDVQRRLAEQIVAAGADLVVGHHPHVPQPVDHIGGVPVLYSLGNGPLGRLSRHDSADMPYGLIAKITVEPHRATVAKITPIHVDNSVVDYQPVPAATGIEVPGMPAQSGWVYGWRVTPARIVDVEQVHRITREAYREYDGVIDPPMSGARETLAAVEAGMRRGGAVLAWDEDRPVGSARYRMANGVVWIKRVSVLPGWRGRGIATAMLAYIEGLARNQGRTRSSLTVRMGLSDNLGLYIRLGYELIEIEPDSRGEAKVGTLVKELEDRFDGLRP